MFIKDCDTPYTKKKMIMYGSDGNKAVRHNVLVQQLVGNMYKSKIEKDEYGRMYCYLYAYFDNLNAEILYCNSIPVYDDTKPDSYYENFLSNGLDSIDNLILTYDRRIEDGGFVGNAIIELVRCYSIKKADQYGQARTSYYQRQREKEARVAAQRVAEENAEREAKIAEENAKRAEFYGWADNMTELRFGKMYVTMSKLFRYDGEVMSRKDFIISKVKDGYISKQVDGVTSWYGSKWEPKQSKPKTEYRLYDKENSFYTITKTEYNFAKYLIDNKIFEKSARVG